MAEATPARITRDHWGFLCGSIMALGASLSFAAARAGILGGLGAVDMIFARYIVAGAIMLPLLLRYGVRDFAGIGLRRSLILTRPGRRALRAAADRRLRLRAARARRGHRALDRHHRQHDRRRAVPARAAEPQPSRRCRHRARRASSLIGWDGLTQPSGERAWLGDLLFFASSVLWAGFTLLLRHWRLPALQATAVVAVLSFLLTTPSIWR